MKKIKRHATVKSIAGIILLLALFTVIVMLIGYRIFTDALLEEYSDGGYLTAQTAARQLNPDRMDVYLMSGGQGDEYVETWCELDRVCNDSGATFVYVIIPDTTDYGHITFVFSTINSNSKYTVYDFGYVRETTNDDYRQKYRALYEQTSERETVVRDQGYIETDDHITVMIPLKGSEGTVRGILCVQRQMDALSGVRKRFFWNILVTLGILILLVIVVQSLFLHRTLLRPIKLVSDEATRFSKENTVPETKLRDKIRNKDEVGSLAESIDEMEEQIQNYIGNLTEITAQKERIITELSLAQRIQEDMLPSKFPAFPDRHEFDIYASMDPAREVGGDFYDFFLIDPDHLCLVMADVSGKGIPAALFMMASKIILANNAMLGKSPAKILTDTNSAICAHNREEMFVTVWLGILELSTGKLTAANGGHEYPVLKKPGGNYELIKDKHGFVIGGMAGLQYKEYELVLEPGSSLFLYTDGVPEATSADNELFGTDRMLAALNEDPEASPEKALELVRSAVDGFVKDAEQFDDMTMLCLSYRGTVTESGPAVLKVDAQVEKLPDVLGFVDALLEEKNCPPKTQMLIDLSIEELFVNIAHYAYPEGNGWAEIRARVTDGEAVFTLIDGGIPYDPLSKPDPDVTLDADERPVGGLGIYLYKKQMDEAAYEYRDGQNRLTVRKTF